MKDQKRDEEEQFEEEHCHKDTMIVSQADYHTHIITGRLSWADLSQSPNGDKREYIVMVD